MRITIAILTTILLAACSTTQENEQIATTNQPNQENVIKIEENDNSELEVYNDYESGTYDELF